MAVDPDDYLEDKEKLEESEYIRQKKMMNRVFYEIKNLEEQLIDMKVASDDAQRANAAGLQNVYDKFLELEERQKSIEELLKSDHIMKIVELIPKEDDILRMLNKIDTSSVARLKEKINKVREDLEDLVDKFTF